MQVSLCVNVSVSLNSTWPSAVYMHHEKQPHFPGNTYIICSRDPWHIWIWFKGINSLWASAWVKVFSLLTEFNHGSSNFLYHLYYTNSFSVSVQSQPFNVTFTLASDAIWRHRTGSTLAQVMACCLMAPIHYLNQCWLIITGVLWH